MTNTIRRGTLIVSCQARKDNPLHGAQFMAAMAMAAEQGGAGAIRANGGRDIAAIRQVTDLPILGLVKRFEYEPDMAITPDSAAVQEAAQAGAHIIALGAAGGRRPAESLGQLITLAKETFGKQVMADIATLKEGLIAAGLGADYLATTLSGYTTAKPPPREPDLALVSALVDSTTLPIIAEGRYWTPKAVAEAFDRGAYAVVVGTAITNPMAITRRFVEQCPGSAGQEV
ncbi:MAG: N-acetylmannosamine-6-phosphate 2-epimerase [Alphaproteobacteria bacterium]